MPLKRHPVLVDPGIVDDKKMPSWLVALGVVFAVWWFNSSVLNHDDDKSPSFPKPVGLTLAPKRVCDSNYGGCVPIAFDVDCASGSGNGPAYVTRPVRVIGADVYGLDADGDGFGCD